MEYGNNYNGNNYPPQQPYDNYPPQQQLAINPTNVLVFGILSCAFSGILGLIFGILGLSKAKNFIAMYGQISTKVKVGKILSIIGIVASIFFFFLCLFYIFTACAAISSHNFQY